MPRLLRRLALARRVFDVHWFQPATALFRTFEAEVVRENLRAAGLALDLGCGDGSLAAVLLDAAGPARWFGVDLEAREVAFAAPTGWYRGVAAASAEALPVEDAAFDLAFSNSALEHMRDLNRVLAEAARVVRPGGRFVFTVPSDTFHEALFWPRFLRAVGARDLRRRYLDHLDHRLWHLRYPSAEDWHQALAEHGFAEHRTVPYLSRSACGWWETVSNLTGGLVHLFQRRGHVPRDAQLAVGLRPAPSRLLGGLTFLLMLPIVLWTAIERSPECTGALYVEAERAAAD